MLKLAHSINENSGKLNEWEERIHIFRNSMKEFGFVIQIFSKERDSDHKSKSNIVEFETPKNGALPITDPLEKPVKFQFNTEILTILIKILNYSRSSLALNMYLNNIFIQLLRIILSIFPFFSSTEEFSQNVKSKVKML